MRPRYSTSLPAMLLAATLLVGSPLLLTGCASSSPATSADRSEVLGVWRYQANGSPFLGEGVFRIVFHQGRLEGELRDSRIGSAALRDVRIRGRQLNLRIEYSTAYSSSNNTLQVSGRVENGKLTATYYEPMWDVTTSQNHRRSRSGQTLNGSLFARRVQSTAPGTDRSPFGCTSPLVESEYDCK